ncbi:MAG TPA: V-type ATPase 116kDa subunit family protein [Deltaproteobacteria bacterium]|nr:V-type ATPase 116kDa subunit family protein [Deltaproteobacteria bacterium]
MVAMFVKSDIRKVTIALERIFYQDVYLELGRAGFVHLFRMEESEASGVLHEQYREEETSSREILSGIETALNALNIRPGKEGLALKMLDPAGDAAYVSRTRSTIERVLRLRTSLQESLDATLRRISYRQILKNMGVDPGKLSTARLITMVFGRVEDTDWEMPSGEDFVLEKKGRYVLGTARPRDAGSMLAFLNHHGFTDLSDDVRKHTADGSEHRKEMLEQRIRSLDAYIEDLREKMIPVLINMHSAYRGYEEVLGALKMSAFSSRAMFITGWMDVADKDRLYTLLQGICGDRFMVTISDTRDPQAPVRLRNMRLLKPFELLVEAIGTPANSEIDPTALTAVTFVLMFGLMFGDLGQGLVLFLCGVLLRWIALKRGGRDSKLSQAGGILIACGLCAALCGVLYGSVFSSEHIIPAVWFHPMENIMRLFSITILMGVFIIVTGLCVNIINNFLASRYTQALFEEKGLAVLIPYTAIVFFSMRYLQTGEGPKVSEVSVLIAVPFVVFCLRGILGHVLFRKPRPQSMTEYAIETFVEIMEIGISMLANTVSFIRVGAFALSHAGLSIVTYTLAGMVDPAMKSAGAIAIIITGNIFIIGLEGLVCAIQSMRLEYYEFFSKFFKGDGVAFSPFTLKAKTSEV